MVLLHHWPEDRVSNQNRPRADLYFSFRA